MTKSRVLLRLALTVLCVCSSLVVVQSSATAGGVCKWCTLHQVQTNRSGVSGSVIVVPAGGHGVRAVAGGGSSCAGCSWQVVPECTFHSNSKTGNDFTACLNGTNGYTCTAQPGDRPGVHYRVQVSRSGPGGPWQYTNSTCIAVGVVPVSVDALLGNVARYVDELVPPTGTISMQPGWVDHRTLVRIPTLFYTHDATAPVSKTFFAGGGAGIAVAVSVRPATWEWLVDGQSVLTTPFPGRPFDGVEPKLDPAHYASYAFVHDGPHSVTVRCSWAATATVRGLGEQPVPGQVRKTSAPLALTALQARAQLESGAS